MEYFWWLYLATRLDSIGEWFGWMTIVSALMVLVALAGVGIASDDSIYSHEERISDEKLDAAKEKVRARFRPWRGWGMVLFVLFSCLYTATPSKKDAMFIAGGVGVIEASKAVAGSAIAKHSVDIVETWLDTELKQLKSKNKETDAPKKEDAKPVEKKAEK